MTAPRVLRIITRLNVGGPARQAIFLSGALEERGFVTELVSGSVGPGEGELSVANGFHTRIPELGRRVDPLMDLRAARSMHRLIRESKPHIVHTHMAKAGALGRLAAHRLGVPVVVHTFHGHVLEGYFNPQMTAGFLAVERRIARWSNALVAVSPAIRDELLALGIGETSKWHVIPVGLELDELIASSTTVEDSRRRLGLPQEGPIVGIVGRLDPMKGIDVLVRAMALLEGPVAGARLPVVGDVGTGPDVLYY